MSRVRGSFLGLILAVQPGICQPHQPLKTAYLLGRHASVTGAADILGMLAAGNLAAYGGFIIAFAVASTSGLVGIVLGLLMPGSGHRGHSDRKMAVVVSDLLRLLASNRVLVLGFLCAFVAGTPMALMGSFYPVYFTHLGYDKQVVGSFSALLSGAMLVAGLAFEKTYGRLGLHRTFVSNLVGLGIALVLIQAVVSPLPIILLMLLTGLAMGFMNVLQTTIAASYIPPLTNGAALWL